MTDRYLVEVSQENHSTEYIAKVIRDALVSIPSIGSLTVSHIKQSYLKVDERFRKIVPGVEL